MSLVFGSNTQTAVKIWGPLANTKVTVDALGNLIGDSWVLSNISVGAKEIVDVRQCFNDVSFLYALGNDQSKCAMALTFAVLLGENGCAGTDGTNHISDGFDKYVENRISQNTDPMDIGIGKFTRRGWLTGIDVGQVDKSRSLCYATVHFIVELK